MTANRPFVVIGNPGSLRLRLFAESLARLGAEQPQIVAYADLLAGRCRLDSLPPEAVVRFESPGKDFEVEKGFLIRGAAEAARENSPFMAADEVRRQPFDRGRIWFPRQWYLGLSDALRDWFTGLQERIDILLTAWPPDIVVFFDKQQCHARCLAAGVAVPDSLGPIGCYEELVAHMDVRKWQRAFVKLAHGSSASGAMAIHRHRGRVEAFSTAELVSVDGYHRLYNTRPVRRLTDEKEVRMLVDALAPHRLHVERWLPKASLGQGTFDLRVLMIAGQPRHTVVREGGSPITNLQLGNRRGPLELLLQRLPAERREAMWATCRQVAAMYPNSLQLGIDVLLTPGWRSRVVLEINAFGDLLPGVLHEGQTTYEAQITALAAGWPQERVPPCGGVDCSGLLSSRK